MAAAPIGYDGTVPRVDEGERLRAGMDVYGADGARLGTVADIGRAWFLIQEGLLTIRNLYLPRNTVARVEGDAAYLNIAGQQAEAMARTELPDEGDAWYGAAPTVVRTLAIPLREQVLVTETVATVKSEVHLRKDVLWDVVPVAANVRRTEVHVEETRTGMEPPPRP